MGGMSRALFLLLIGGFAATASAAPLPGAGEPMPAYPDPLGVAAPVAGVSGGALLVGGGANFPHGFPWEGGKKVWHDTVYALAPGATNWTPAGRLPRTLAYAVTLTTPEGILVAGGSDADRHYADCFLLRWDGAQLVTEPLPALPLPVANACGALIGRVVFVAGGEAAPGATAAVTNMWALHLDARAGGWMPTPGWPGPARTLAAAGVLQRQLVLVGGVALSADPAGKPARRYLNDAYAYDPMRATWRRLADLPNPVAAAPSPLTAVADTRLLVLGGDDGSKYGFQPVQEHPGFPPRILAYDARADVWSAAGALPVCRVTVPAVEWGGLTVIPSGEMRPGVRSPEVRGYRWEGP
jgi:N-acetylneuraminic acid mutarotase